MNTDPLAPQDFDLVLEKAHEQEGRIASYHEAAREHLDLKNAELLAKAEMLRKTRLLDFIKQKLAKILDSIKENYNFQINDSCHLRSSGFGLVYNKYDDAFNVLEKLERALSGLGVPMEEIVRYTFISNVHNNPRASFMGVFVNLTTDIIEKIIEKETQARLAIVERPFRQALEKLQATTQALEEQTGLEVCDEHPERSLGFTERFIENTRDDIRKKVKRDIMGAQEKNQTAPVR